MNNSKVKVMFPINDPYGELLGGAMLASFPASIKASNVQVVDCVSTEIIGSGKQRFGPMPNIESQAAIRAVVRKSVENGSPIPILCPWGSKKCGNDRSIDVAELSGLKTLLSLQERVSKYYAPGLDVRLRLEDVGGFYLFRDEGNEARTAGVKYVADFEALVRILGLRFIETVKESQMMTEEEYTALCDHIFLKMLVYIQETDQFGFDNFNQLQSWKDLVAEGWTGEIPSEQRNFYRCRYAKIYGSDVDTQSRKLAEYMAGSLARYRLNATGIRENWGKNFIQLNFAPPAPGSPRGIVERRVYYRTIHMNYTRDHLPPWRARGYYRICNDGVPTPALMSWFDSRPVEECRLTLSNNGESVEIDANYMIM